MESIYLSKADITAVEEGYVLDALRSGWVAPAGPHVDAFESEIARLVGVSGGLALSSGTAALHVALLALGVGPGTVVPVSTMTFAASANAIAYTGAQPVFVDSLEEDGNVDPDLLITAVDTLLAEGQRVGAVMTVDLFGRCADYGQICAELESRGIPLVEDAAEALGACLGGRAAGSFGRAAALSFNGNKVMTTSGGGMLVSDDAEMLAKARYLSTQARQPVPWYEHEDVGYNYRLSNLLAALGRGQLTRLDAMISRRRSIRARYAAALHHLPGVRMLGRAPDRSDAEDNCWLTAVAIDPRECPVSADALIKGLAVQNIEARRLWKPMHAQPVFARHQAFVTGASDSLFASGVALPSGSSLTDHEVARTLSAVIDILDS
jgi:dTDP-4-amino-4,6-dideoxygalactose transaminase